MKNSKSVSINISTNGLLKSKMNISRIVGFESIVGINYDYDTLTNSTEVEVITHSGLDIRKFLNVFKSKGLCNYSVSKVVVLQLA